MTEVAVAAGVTTNEVASSSPMLPGEAWLNRTGLSRSAWQQGTVRRKPARAATCLQVQVYRPGSANAR